MLLITKSVLAVMISFLISIILGSIIIPMLKKISFNQEINTYLKEAHRAKEKTPTMGGIIFILSTLITIIILTLMNKMIISTNFIIVIITFLGYGFIGFLDDFLIIMRKNNKGLTSNQKFMLQIILSIIFFYLFLQAGNEPLLWIHTLNIKQDLGYFYGLFLLFILVASSMPST